MVLAAAVLAGVLATASVQEGSALPAAHLRRLRALGEELAELGLARELERLRTELVALGDDPDDLARAARDWERVLGRDRRKGARPDRAAKEVRREARRLTELLEREELTPEVEARIARAAVRLDADAAAAHAVLGHVERAGSWWPPEVAAWRDGEARLAEAVQGARRLAPEIETGPSELPPLVRADGEHGRAAHRASAHGLVLHGRQPAPKLARILRQALRAVALSSHLRGGPLEVPELRRGYELFLTDSAAGFDTALDEALENLGLSASERDAIVAEDRRSFLDRRGWRTSRWRAEADFAALVAWAVLRDELGDGAQPCLVAGHLNWLCLQLLGTSLPTVLWRDATGPGRTRTFDGLFEADVVWRSARTSLHGCRTWLAEGVRDGSGVPWWRAMADQLGRVQGEELFKTTLMHELLVLDARLVTALDGTRADDERVAAFESALDTTLPELEERFARWLLAEERARGVAQVLDRLARPRAATPGDELLAALAKLRAQALAASEDVSTPLLAPDLSAGAAAHARYLAQNPDQQGAWPAAHEEYAERPGFTPAGARAGLAAVIAYTDDPEVALEQWMGTFYHRLPLLDPGLFGVGFGQAEGISVLDALSLRAPPTHRRWVPWPSDGARDVPRAFVRETPNPVPGADQDALGYPVTLQVFRPAGGADLEVTLALTEGDVPVPCHRLSPDAPLFPELVPADAWGLIPEERLKRATRYTVTGSIGGEPVRWSFRTGR